MDNYRSNRGGGNYGSRRDFNPRDRGGRRPEMFPAICDNCGRECEVPFKPSSDKPIYCSKCFEDISPRRDNRPPRRDNYSNRESNYKPKDTSSEISQLKEQLSSISSKLDKLLRLLTPVEIEEIKEEKKPKKAVKKTKKVSKKKD